mmetsp:Transcript_30236/g.96587  ORF Transcript_30236/g.96587 Transcript_30236/m.96587 type:complete len:484 (+) Transcript_30236:58-1509(+)
MQACARRLLALAALGGLARGESLRAQQRALHAHREGPDWPHLPVPTLRHSAAEVFEHLPPLGACSIAYAAHDGLGNQLLALLNADLVAHLAGCSLYVPPILDHLDVAINSTDRCLRGQEEEERLIKAAAQAYRTRKLQWSQLFQMKTGPRVKPMVGHLKQEIDTLSVLPMMPCKDFNTSRGEYQMWKNFATHLQDAVKQRPFQPAQTWALGSAYRVFGSRCQAGLGYLGFSSLFSGWAREVKQAVGSVAAKLTQGAASKHYACIHFRSASDVDGSITEDEATVLRGWLKVMTVPKLRHKAARPASQAPPAAAANVTFWQKRGCRSVRCVDSRGRALNLPGLNLRRAVTEEDAVPVSMPIYIMSAMDKDRLSGLLGESCQGKCTTLDGLGEDPNKLLPLAEASASTARLIVDMATCARASAIYLPNHVHGARVVWGGKQERQVQEASEALGSALSDVADRPIFRSTLSSVIAEMSSFGSFADGH